MSLVRTLWEDESGASAVEYGLTISLVEVMIILTVTPLGKNINRKFSSAAARIAT